MAAPNIVNVASIYGKTAGLAVGTSPSAIVTNSAGSNKVLKINSLIISNIDGVNSATVNIDVYKNQTTAFRVAYTIAVPPDATLVILSKDTSIYLEENDSLRITSSDASRLEAVCSYEEIA